MALKAIMSITIILLFGILFAILAAVGYYFRLPLTTIVIMAVILVLIQWAAGPSIIRATVNMRPLQKGESWIAEAIDKICKKTGTPRPRKIYIANMGEPNAFVYGRTARGAEMVITQGMLNNLNRDEVEAVIGHELGHINHRDMIVMTIAGSVPVMLYLVAQNLIWGGRGRREGAAAAVAIGFGAFLLYFISQLIVMWLSRSREYYADAFSAQKYGRPDLLASGLAKITYGLGMAQKKSSGPLRAFCIGDPEVSTFELTHFREEYRDLHLSKEEITKAIQWERKNKALRWLEIFRTHPLTFKRIARLKQIEKAL